MTNEEKMVALEAFLRGELSDEADENFRQLLRTDPGLQAELNLRKEMEEALGPSPLNDFRASVRQVVLDNRPAPRSFRGPLLWLLAAGLTLILIVAWMLLRPSRPNTDARLFADYFQAPANLGWTTQQRSGGEPGTPQGILLDSLYQAKNYAASLNMLEKQAQNPGFQPSSTYYFQLGILQLANREPGRALENLDRVEVGYRYEKQWYRALALLLSGSARPETEAALRGIVQSDSPYKKDAADLLRRMDGK